MFSPKRFFSRYTLPFNPFKSSDNSIDSVADLPTPPESPSFPRPYPKQKPPRINLKELHQEHSSKSAPSLSFRSMNGTVDEQESLPSYRPSSSPSSPFRSVERMTRPFPLRLPSNPPSNQSSPGLGSPTLKTLQIPGELGANPQLIHEPTFNAPNRRRPVGLLPSPVFWEKKAMRQDTPPPSTYCHPDGAPSDYFNQWEPCDSPTIPVWQLPSWNPPRPRSPQKKDHLHDHISPTNGQPPLMETCPQPDSPTTPPSRATSVDRDRSPHSGWSHHALRERSSSRAVSILSSEGEWLAGNLSYSEDLPQDLLDEPVLGAPEQKRPKAEQTKLHSIQPSSSRCSVGSRSMRRVRKSCSSTESPVFGTVVTTKPRLVTVYRSASTMQTRELPSSISKQDSQDKPSTPRQWPKEISAFSPETPPEDDLPDSGYSSQNFESSSTSSDHQTRFGSGSLKSTPPETPPTSFKFSPTSALEISPGKVIESYCHSRSPSSSTVHQSTAPILPRPLKFHEPPPVEPLHAEHDVFSRCEKFSWILAQIAKSIDAFPTTTLQLDSPVVQCLQLQAAEQRTAKIQSSKSPSVTAGGDWDRSNNTSLDLLPTSEEYLIPLRRIFPQTEDYRLSALVATLLAQRQLSVFSCSNALLPTSDSLDELDCIPAKAKSMLGIQCRAVTANQQREKLLKRIAAKNVEILDLIVDRLLETICGRPDVVMKRALLVVIELVG